MTARVFVEARQLTRDNGAELWEWADSKPHYADGGVVDGLTVWTPDGRSWARFGDWVAKDADGGFWAVAEGEFDAFPQVGAAREQGDEVTP